MGAGPAPATTAAVAAQERLLTEYARLLWQRYRARLYLFGSRARGTAGEHSDYDLVAVSAAFTTQPRLRRCPDRRELWLEAGGWRKALDLHCYTPEEFRKELAGLGFLGQAKRHGELVAITSGQRAPRDRTP